MSTAPLMVTPRLTMRAHRLPDLADYSAMWADPAVTRHIGGRPLSGEEAWARLLRYVGHWTLLGYGFWAIIETATGRFAGETGFAEFKRDMQPPIVGTPEIGWVLAPWAQGQGFATEAVQAATAWFDGHHEAAVTTCLIAPANSASLRVAGKCGYHEIRRAVYKDAPAIVFERPRGGLDV
jgi:RimJ/RimL family protein N-acetyltransferase